MLYNVSELFRLSHGGYRYGNKYGYGTQWGDEGKGKIVDWIAERADVVVRSQGGNNAGHTVVVDDKAFALRLYQAAFCTITKQNIVGTGVVIDPKVVCYKEIEGL